MRLRRIRYHPPRYRVVGSTVEIHAVTETKTRFYEVRDGSTVEIARGMDTARRLAALFMERKQ